MTSWLPSINHSEKKRSDSVPNKLGGNITPWSFYREQPEAEQSQEKQAVTKEAPIAFIRKKSTMRTGSVSPNHLFSPKLIDTSLFVLPDQKIVSDRQNYKILDLLHEYLDEENALSLATPRRKQKSQEIYAEKRSLLPKGCSPMEQISIRSIFADFKTDELTSPIKDFNVLKVKQRRRPNIRILYQKADRSLSGMPIEVMGRRKEVRFRPKD